MSISRSGGVQPRVIPFRGLAKAPVALAISLAIMGSQVGRAAEATNEESLDEITVTGSRIQQAIGMTTPTPVAALSSEEIVAMSPGSLTEAMTQLPQFYGSATAENFGSGTNGFFTSAGGGSLNLRGVGSRRTLTLLDGRRVVPASVYGGPDINMFPTEMMSRVETVTGGASAQYGTDAVTGVVNFILDTEFEGFRGRAQYGATEQGDGDATEFALSFGTDIGERAHVLLSAEYFEQDSIESLLSRDWYEGWSLIRSSAAGAGTSQDNPLFVPANHLAATNASYDGIITAWQAQPGFTVPASFGPLAFNPDGSYGTFVRGNPYSAGFTGASNAHSIASGGSGTDNSSDRANLLPGSERANLYGYFDFDLTDSTTLFLQAMYSDQQLTAVNVTGSLYPGGVGHNATIYSGNPYIPADLQAQMTANNIASFTLGRIGHSADIGGEGYVVQDTQVMSATTGFHTDIASDGYFNGWSVDGYYQYGQTDLDARQEDGLRLDRLYLAADAVRDSSGQIKCRVTVVSGLVPDCVPINLFGRGQASAAAVDWVVGFDPGVAVTTTPYLPDYPPETYSYTGDEAKHRLAKIKQHVFEISASGQVSEGWAGAISAAVGANYRKESVDQKVQASQGNVAADPFYYPVWCNDGATAGGRALTRSPGAPPAGHHRRARRAGRHRRRTPSSSSSRRCRSSAATTT